MGNYLKGFIISLTVHASVVLLFISAGAGITKNIKSEKIVDISMISVDKPEIPEEEPPTPVSPPPPPPPQIIEQPKPKPVAESVVMPKDDEIRYADATEESVAPAEPDIPVYSAPEHDPEAEKLAAAEQGLRMGYVKNNYSYIQKRIKKCLIYPSQAKRTGIKGRVTLMFTINQDGTISDVKVETSSGHDMLDEAAKNALFSAAPFPPPPVSAQIVIPIDFKLI